MKKIIVILFLLTFTNTYSQKVNKEEVSLSSKTIESQKILSDEEKIIAELKKWDEKLNTLKSDFRQEVFFKQAQIRQKVEGSIAYKKPDKLRIEHFSPNKQIIVTDKVEIQVYKPEDAQIYKMPWDLWKKNQNFSQILDFGNYSEIMKNNKIDIFKSSTTIKIQLKNKQNPSLYTLTLSLSPENFFPYQSSLEVEDTVINTELYKTEINGNLDDKIFKLEKAEKAEIIEIKSK